MTYTVVLLHEAEGRYSAIVPALNVASWGHTVPEALSMVEEALRAVLASMREYGDAMPEDSSVITVRMGTATDGFIFRERIAA